MWDALVTARDTTSTLIEYAYVHPEDQSERFDRSDDRAQRE